MQTTTHLGKHQRHQGIEIRKSKEPVAKRICARKQPGTQVKEAIKNLKQNEKDKKRQRIRIRNNIKYRAWLEAKKAIEDSIKDVLEDVVKQVIDNLPPPPTFQRPTLVIPISQDLTAEDLTFGNAPTSPAYAPTSPAYAPTSPITRECSEVPARAGGDTPRQGTNEESPRTEANPSLTFDPNGLGDMSYSELKTLVKELDLCKANAKRTVMEDALREYAQGFSEGGQEPTQDFSEGGQEPTQDFSEGGQEPTQDFSEGGQEHQVPDVEGKEEPARDTTQISDEIYNTLMHNGVLTQDRGWSQVSIQQEDSDDGILVHIKLKSS